MSSPFRRGNHYEQIVLICVYFKEKIHKREYIESNINTTFWYFKRKDHVIPKDTCLYPFYSMF